MIRVPCTNQHAIQRCAPFHPKAPHSGANTSLLYTERTQHRRPKTLQQQVSPSWPEMQNCRVSWQYDRTESYRQAPQQLYRGDTRRATSESSPADHDSSGDSRDSEEPRETAAKPSRMLPAYRDGPRTTKHQSVCRIRVASQHPLAHHDGMCDVRVVVCSSKASKSHATAAEPCIAAEPRRQQRATRATAAGSSVTAIEPPKMLAMIGIDLLPMQHTTTPSDGRRGANMHCQSSVTHDSAMASLRT
jgi:hypothetical protein